MAKTGLDEVYQKIKRWFYHNILGKKTKDEKLQESAKRIEELEEWNQRKDERIEKKKKD